MKEKAYENYENYENQENAEFDHLLEELNLESKQFANIQSIKQF